MPNLFVRVQSGAWRARGIIAGQAGVLLIGEFVKK